jgi:galactokinase
MTSTIAERFREHFGAWPGACVLAPGRVNLIGEHIDYSGGHVLPIALGLGIRIALSPRTDGQFRLRAGGQDAPYNGPALAERISEPFWVNYFLGTVREFEKLGHEVPGLDAVVEGDIPRASGLSSSAAFEVATAWALQALLGTSLTRQEIALLGQRAENQFVGVNCGIMDQTASACGRAGHAMLLDCNTLDLAQVPLEFGGRAVMLVAHSGVHRGLSASAYNQRRSKCEAAVPILARTTGRAMKFLCEASLEDLEAARGEMDDEMRRRARHAVAEETRVQEATRALAAGDLEGFGRLLDASHESLRDDYEVSCEELDELTARIRSHPGAYGSRLTGAGFGGCTISLVRADAADAIIEDLRKHFYAPRNAEPIAFTTTAHEGVRVL